MVTERLVFIGSDCGRYTSDGLKEMISDVDFYRQNAIPTENGRLIPAVPR